MQPIKLQVTGSGIAGPIIPDICQNPFNYGIGVSLLTGGGLTTAIISVEHSFDFRTVMAPSFNGLTAVVDGLVATAIWFPNSGMNVTTVTATIGTAIVTNAINYAYPVAAIRLNVISATATAVVVANFLQSVNSP